MKLFPKKQIRGEITIPPDKSISHRAVLFSALARGKSEIINFLDADDCLSTIDCMQRLGVRIERDGRRVTVHGNGLRGLQKPDGVLYTGNSGTTTRLLSGILCGQSFSSKITGDASICRRPMGRVTEPLHLMGADIVSQNGCCPLTVTPSPLHGISYPMPHDSAQVKSAILLAGLYAQGTTTVIENHPSRNHTELMLSAFGAKVDCAGRSVTVAPADELYAQKIEVPGDISSAAFFIVAALILPNSQLTVKNVGLNPTRTGILDVLRGMGADIQIENLRLAGREPVGDLTVTSSSLHGTMLGEEIMPRLIDEIPIIAVAAALADGETVIRGAGELKVKESNRIDTVCTELSNAGVDIRATEDGMVIRGGNLIHGASYQSHGDHRIAMACSVLALAASGESIIEGAECASISFPSFYQILDKL